MITIEQFSRIVTAVHEAAVDAECWAVALDMLRSSLGGTACALIGGGRADRDVTYCSVPEFSALHAYRDYYRKHDYVMAAMDSSAPGLVQGGESLVALNPRSEFNADWMRPNAMDDGLFVRITDPTPQTFLVAAPRRAESFATTDNVRAINALVPHLQMALRTQQSLADLRTDALTGLHPVDTFTTPAAVVGADMTVKHLNSAADALLRCSTAIVVRSGRVHLSSPSADITFRRAVSRAVGPTRIGHAFAVPRAESIRPLIVHALPLTMDDERRALVVVVNPDLHREPPKSVLQQLFSLTDSEAEVALRISRGRGLSDIADELSLSTATVKTHLQHVYQKTDTHRQSELTRLVLTLMP